MSPLRRNGSFGESHAWQCGLKALRVLVTCATLIRRCGRIRFLKLLGIGLDPTEDRRVIHLDTAVDEHELEVAVTDREH
jgi:hypothetical protein